MSESEKVALQKYAVIEFSKVYKKQCKGNLVYVGQCTPPIPDTKCTLEGRTIYIEVAHLYGAGSDAQRLLGRKGNAYPSAEKQKAARLNPLDVRIGDEFTRILNQKATKTYTGEPRWLLIRNANPLWNYYDFKSYLSNVTIPPKTPFEKIWLLCGPTAESGIIQLPVQ